MTLNLETGNLSKTSVKLISESSGDRWALHMCHGTARVLQQQGPIDSSSPLDKTLLAGFRVLEATRAIMYGDETFLSQDVWQPHRPGLTSEGADWSDPMETIHRIVIQVASFSKR